MRSMISCSACPCPATRSATAEDGAFEDPWRRPGSRVGRIMDATDTLINGVDPTPSWISPGNILQSIGAQFTVVADLMDNLEAASDSACKGEPCAGKGIELPFGDFPVPEFHHPIPPDIYTGRKGRSHLELHLGFVPFHLQQGRQESGSVPLPRTRLSRHADGRIQGFRYGQCTQHHVGLKPAKVRREICHDLLFNAEREIPPTLDWSMAMSRSTRLLEP